jgi:hypothetical protein
MMPATTTKPLRGWHGDAELKAATIAEMKAHREADELVRGFYFRDGKGCAVGCLTRDPEGGHAQYPERWGIPTWLAHLEDHIFEGLPEEKALLWPERFLTAVPLGGDFKGLADRLAIARLKEECLPLSGQWLESERTKVVAAIEQTIAALEGKGDRAAAAAESAAAAAAAARSARSARSAAARSAWSAAAAARSAWSAAARSARSAAAAAYEREADRLIAALETLSASA